MRVRGNPVFARLPSLPLANWFAVQHSDSDLSRLPLSLPGAFTCTSGPWPPCLEGRRDDPLDPVPVITLHNVNNIILLPSNTPNGEHYGLQVVSSIDHFPGTAIYKVLAEHKKGHLLSFQKTNAEEEIFSVAKMTGIVTIAGNLVERTTHKVHVLVSGAGSKHVSMVTLFINVVPPLTTMKQPPSLVVAVKPKEIPKVVKAGSKPQKGHLWKIVYGNKEKVLPPEMSITKSFPRC